MSGEGQRGSPAVAPSEEMLQLQATAERRALILTMVRRVALHVLSSRTGIEALQHIAHGACRLTRTRSAAIAVAQPDGMGLQEVVTVGSADAMPSGEALLAEAQRIVSAGRGPRGSSAEFDGPGGLAPDVVVVPIRRRRTVLGALCVARSQGESPIADDADVTLRALAENASVAVHELHQITRQRELTRAILAAQEDERRAVAYEIHDGLTQYVMAAHAHMEAFRTAHGEGCEDDAAQELDLGLRYLKDAVIETRRLVSGLRSLSLDDLGLAGAVEQLLVDEKSRAGWDEALFRDEVGDQRFDTVVETTAYRVVQEALTNARRHAQSARVAVSLRVVQQPKTASSGLEVEVRDWGSGFDPGARRGEYSRLGLHGMAERVALAGGALDVHSALGAGTTVRAVLPTAACLAPSAAGPQP